MKNTTTNTAAASLSDERKSAAITACALMIKGICLTTPNAEWTERIEGRIHYLLRQMTPTPQADAAPSELREAARQFHNLTQGDSAVIIRAPSAEKRDAIIAAGERLRAAIAAGGAQEPIYQVMVGDKWVDSTAAEYAAVSNEKRIVYASPLPRVAATAWQPIETAPKDGTKVLLSNGLVVAQGEWANEPAYIKEHRDLEGRYIDQDEFDGFEGWIDFIGGMLPEPTHWMPLPAAPAASNGEQEVQS